jgi:hypothetical protein
MSDISVDSTARDQAAAVLAREISARELLDLHLTRIEERNGEINAIVSLDAERARGSAAAADQWLAAGDPVGPLHGLPFAVKDTHPVAGWRTTFGSPLHADFVPDEDTLAVPGRDRRPRELGCEPAADAVAARAAGQPRARRPARGSPRARPYTAAQRRRT